MSAARTTETHRALRCKAGVCEAASYELIAEEPLLIRIEDKPYSVVMRTPGEESFHAAGFCLGEGIVDRPEDIKTIGHDENLDPNVVDIWIEPRRRRQINAILKRRVFVSQTSCGICGKEMIKDLHQVVTPAKDGFEIHMHRVLECVDKLAEHQSHYRTTRCSHAALLFDDRVELISFAEDVGRHNALDKAIGKAFMQGKLSRAGVLVLSSRLSYELVQKAARARVPVIVSISRPTALAVEMGRTLNMTLAFPSGESELTIVCGEHRIKRE